MGAVCTFAADFLGFLLFSQKNSSTALSGCSKPRGNLPEAGSHVTQLAVTDSVAALQQISTNTTFRKSSKSGNRWPLLRLDTLVDFCSDSRKLFPCLVVQPGTILAALTSLSAHKEQHQQPPAKQLSELLPSRQYQASISRTVIVIQDGLQELFKNSL